MKVHFIYPSNDSREKTGISYGLASISAVLKKHGHEVSLHHITKELDRKEVINIVRKNNPDIVGFIDFTRYHGIVLKCAEWIKSEFDVPIIVGGPHATLSPEETLESQYIDYVCVGEGEYAMLDVVNNLHHPEKLEKIPNIYLKKDHKIIINPVRPPIKDLDALPFADISLFDVETFLKYDEWELPFMAGRGCPFNCAYCSNVPLRNVYKGFGAGSYVRFKSPETVIKEIKTIRKKYNIKKIGFNDPTFTLSPAWIEKFCRIYKKEVHLPFRCLAQCETITDDMIRNMKQAGCYLICYGVESGDEYYRNKVLNKHLTNEKIEKIFKLTKKEGIEVGGFFIVGAPFETTKRIKNTYEFAKKLNADYVSVSVFQPEFNTDLYHLCKKNNFFTKKTEKLFRGELQNFNPFQESTLNYPNLSRKEIHKWFAKFRNLNNEIAIKKRFKPLYPAYKILEIFLGLKTYIFLEKFLASTFGNKTLTFLHKVF